MDHFRIFAFKVKQGWLFFVVQCNCIFGTSFFVMIISMVHFCCTLLSKIILEGSCTKQKVVVDTHLKHKIRVAFLPKTFFCQPPTYPFSYFCYLSRFFLSFWEIFWKLDWGISRIYCCVKIRKKSRFYFKNHIFFH